MRSPLETQQELRNKKSKYERALEKTEKKQNSNRATLPPEENGRKHFRDSDGYNKMSAFERSLLENRRQREYLLEEYR